MKVKVWIGGKEKKKKKNIERMLKNVVIICMMCSFASYIGMILCVCSNQDYGIKGKLQDS